MSAMLCHSCRKPKVDATGKANHDHDAAQGYFGYSICALWDLDPQELAEAMVDDFARGLTDPPLTE
ncbi:hypothetical protein, partial [Nocardioides massiliensis]